MNISFTLDLTEGFYGAPSKAGMQQNIDALQRAIDGKPLVCDTVGLLSAKSILEGIQEQLP